MEGWRRPRRSCRRAAPPRCEDPVRSLELSECLAALFIARPVGLLSQCPRIVGKPQHSAPSGRVRDRLRDLVARLVVLSQVVLLLVALLWLCRRSRNLRFLRRLAVLRESFHFGFKLGVP